MVVQIYSITKPEDAKKLCEMGVDNIGVMVGNQQGKYTLTYDFANKVFNEILPGHKKVAFSKSEDIRDLFEICDKTRPDILHIGTTDIRLKKSDVDLITDKFPDIELMKSIFVQDKTAIQDALFWQDSVHYLLLDTTTAESPSGATGKIHDWNIGREIVNKIHIPVILAGGLKIENVAEAIRTVRPYGVDSMTGTNLDDSTQKDFNKVSEFVKLAKSVTI